MSSINYISYKNAAKDSQFFIFDRRSALPLLLWSLFPSWTFFYVCVGFMITLTVLKHNGWPLNMAIRRLLLLVSGPRKMCRYVNRRSMIDK